MHFLCHRIKFTNFVLDENTDLWPETTCLDGWMAGFSENRAISAPNYSWSWVQCIFKVYFDKDAS